MSGLENQISGPAYTVRYRVQDFRLPPVHDMLVIGKDAPVGCASFRRALDLLVGPPFAHIEIEDEVISDILIRETILLRLPKEKLIKFVQDRIKPLLATNEVLHIDLEVTLHSEEVLS